MLSIISSKNYIVNLVVNYVVNYLDQNYVINLVVNYVVNYLVISSCPFKVSKATSS